jgi:hypothetical protein
MSSTQFDALISRADLLLKRLERLRSLRIEHRDLDDVISRLQMDLYTDEIQLRRLKKRKLMLTSEP